MKELNVVLRGAISRVLFRDEAMADAAYVTVKEAMEAFKEFGNDRERTVEFVADFSKHSYRLQDVQSVSISVISSDAYDLTFEREMLEAAFSERLRKAVEAATETPVQVQE